MATDDIWEEIYAEAETLFKRHSNSNSGQQITPMDHFAYWLIRVAYTKGENVGYDTGYKDGTMNSGGV